MATFFGQAQAVLAKYWFERLIFTSGSSLSFPGTLPKGNTSIFSATAWTPANGPVWQANLRRLWATQSASVQWSWKGDAINYNGGSQQGFADAIPQAPVTTATEGVGYIDSYAPATSQLSLNANNSSGGTIASYNLSYAVEMKRLTIADKLQMGGAAAGYAITPADQQAIAPLGKDAMAIIQATVRDGAAPLSIPKQMEALVLNQRLGDHPNSGLYHVTATTTSGSVPFASCAPLNPGQEFVVLEELAIEGGPILTLYVDRDTDTAYMQLNGAAFSFAGDQPWDPWVPALTPNGLVFRADVPTTTVTNTPIRLRVGRYRLTDQLYARMDPVGAAAAGVNPLVIAAARAGVDLAYFPGALEAAGL